MTNKYKLPKWPPNWPHVQPKVKKHYQHTVTVTCKPLPREDLLELARRVLQEDKEAEEEFSEWFVGFAIQYTSETKSKALKRALEQSINKPLVEYERKELPTFNEERIET